MPNWTDEQKNAIEARGGSILVSAAAGSGKTAVLVERVISRITDKTDPCDADRFLVVTFTKSAATEMKERIAIRLSQLIRQEPDNARLRRQKLLLERAHISTISSFCSSVIKEYFQNLDIPADFRIAEESEINVLRSEAVEEILNEMYEGDDRDRFIELVEQVSSEKDDRALSKTILNLSKYISSHPFPDIWLDEKLKMFSDEAAQNGGVWTKIIADYVHSAIKCCLEMNHSIRKAVAGSPDAEKAYSNALKDDEEQYIKILETDDWDTLFRLISDFRWTHRGKSEHEFAKATREAQKEIVKKLKNYLCADSQMNSVDIKKLAPIVTALFELVLRFRERFSQKKKELGCVDYSDLEHMTIGLLTEVREDTIMRTALAKELSNQFDEILIDEYQDTNEAQDMIFRAISKDEGNLFMVGDVKQSIYRFRQAMPEIFIDKYNSFRDYPNGFPAKITLGKNFRSREEVTDIVNFFFTQIMHEEAAQINYDKNHLLNHGAAFTPAPDTCCEMLLCDPNIKQKDADTAEAEMIAQKINTMIAQGYQVQDNGALRSARFSDFCILLRSTKNRADVYAKTLEEHGIPAYSPVSGGFFESREISLVLALLRIISNPIDDVNLTAVLISPLFGFTPDEITQIRLVDRSVPMWSALTMSAAGGNEKCTVFLEYIRGLRKLAVSLPCDRLILKIYEKTGIADIVGTMKNGSSRIANLRVLVQYARSYEKTGLGGLTGFLSFLERTVESDNEMAGGSAANPNDDVVRIMSIHKAKGLEFPVCIVAGLGHQFNKQDLRSNLLIHQQLGVGMKILGTERLNRYQTLPRVALQLALERESIAEEMRILYVAMTRAREKLILSAAIKSLERNVIKLSAILESCGNIPPFRVLTASQFSDWLILCALRHPNGRPLRDMAQARSIRCIDCNVPLSIELDTSESVTETAESQTADSVPDESVIEMLRQRAEYRYPYESIAKIPSKVTASELSHEIFTAASYIKRPRFLTEGGLTPAERGTALHKFMQFADFSAAEADLVSEIERLSHLGYLTAQEAEAVDLRKIRAFLKSELANELKTADEVMREMRFACEIPVNAIDSRVESDETVFLQGVTDCIYKKGGKIFIIDYKTDRIEDSGRLAQMYSAQLAIYARAFEQILELPVGGKFIYSFSLDRLIEV